MAKVEPRLLTIQKAASFLGVNVNTIRNWAKRGVLDGVKVGSRGDWRFTEDNLLRMIKSKNTRGQDNVDRFRLAAIVNSSDDAIISKNLRGIITSWNPAAEKIFGFKAKETIGKPITLIIPKELYSEEKEIISKIKKGKRIEHYETIRKKKNGEKFLVSLTISPIKDNVGNIIGASKIVRDISDNQQRLEAQLYLASIIASSDDAIVSKNLNGIVTSWNSGAEHIFGYTSEQAIGKSIKSLIIPKDRYHEEDEILKKLKRGIRIDHFETERMRKDGMRIIVSVTISPIKDPTGRIIGASKVARDITEQKKNQNDLAYLASLVESTSDAIWSKDLTEAIMSWNKGAERLYGYTPEEVLGKPIDMIVPPHKRKELVEATKKLKTGYSIHDFETQRLTKDGKIIDVSISLSKIKDAQGNMVGVSSIARDITQRKQLEKDKDDFIGAASHELKTPLTSQKMFIQLMQKALAQAKVENLEQYIIRIQKQNERMVELVNEMLTIARLEAGKLLLKKERCFLPECIKEIVSDSMVAFPSHKIIIKGSHSKEVSVDKERIGEVFSNLLTNAIKYSPQANKIIVHFTEDKNMVTVSVQDFGIGIGKEDQKLIFDRFFRVPGENEKTYPGFGMGLYIAKEIVIRHKGKLWVESLPGKGSTFFLSLPIWKKNNSTRYRRM